MAQILVRNVDEGMKTRLKSRAKRNGRSMEAEALEILREGLRKREPQRGLGSEIVAMFSGSGIGLEPGEEIPEWRGFPVEPMTFDE